MNDGHVSLMIAFVFVSVPQTCGHVHDLNKQKATYILVKKTFKQQLFTHAASHFQTFVFSQADPPEPVWKVPGRQCRCDDF